MELQWTLFANFFFIFFFLSSCEQHGGFSHQKSEIIFFFCEVKPSYSRGCVSKIESHPAKPEIVLKKKIVEF